MMAKRDGKTAKDGAGRGPRSAGGRTAETKDVFSRLDAETVDRLDELVEGIQPQTTRSAVIAMMIRQYVDAKWPEHEARKKASK